MGAVLAGVALAGVALVEVALVEEVLVEAFSTCPEAFYPRSPLAGFAPSTPKTIGRSPVKGTINPSGARSQVGRKPAIWRHLADPLFAMTLCVLGPSPGNTAVCGCSHPIYRSSKHV